MFGQNFSALEKKQYLENIIGYALLVDGVYIPEEKVATWRAHIPYVEVLEDNVLLCFSGIANDPEEAINDYWMKVFTSEVIVCDPQRSRLRREFEVHESHGIFERSRR